MTGPTISASLSVRDALAHIDATGLQFAAVLDADGRLIATVSDGDIRRGLLRGVTLTDPIAACANATPRTAPVGMPDAEVLRLMKRHGLHHMPVVDGDRRFITLKRMDDLLEPPQHDNLVVLMVGGLGRRLGELTRDVPKPMLKVGDRPLLETIVGNFRDQGFRRLRFAVNYRADLIEEHFGDGSRFDCQIRYLRERERMGTAGALSLLDEPVDAPVLVSNGDLLLRLDYGAMLDHHVAHRSEATMAVREYEQQIPYGVVRTEADRILRIDEKPTQKVLISGGLYVLSPGAVARVPGGRFFDMPALFDEVIASGGTSVAYRIDGYWLDIGHLADYERAQHDYVRHFAADEVTGG